MRNIIMIAAALVPLWAGAAEVSDTTFTVNGKDIVVGFYLLRYRADKAWKVGVYLLALHFDSLRDFFLCVCVLQNAEDYHEQSKYHRNSLYILIVYH